MVWFDDIWLFVVGKVVVFGLEFWFYSEGLKKYENWVFGFLLLRFFMIWLLVGRVLIVKIVFRYNDVVYLVFFIFYMGFCFLLNVGNFVCVV